MFKQNQIASAIIIAGIVIAGAILIKGSPSGTTIDPKKAETKLTKSMPTFSQCLDSGKYTQAVKDSTENGSKAGVNGTPKGFILKGEKVIETIEGAQPANTVKDILDKALSSSNQKEISIKLPPITDSDFIKGNTNAPISVIVYVDYKCPFCGKFFKETEKTVLDTYVNEGKIKLIIRDFAFLSESSIKAAEAARCAGDQGKFWEYYDNLFSHQGEEKSDLSIVHLKSIAKELKLK